MNYKGKNGITLIALVITIIVLIILAMITIGALTGENGILNRTQSAADETIIARADEQAGIITVSASIRYRHIEEFIASVEYALNNTTFTGIGPGNTVILNGDGTITIRDKETKREYKITDNFEVRFIE